MKPLKEKISITIDNDVLIKLKERAENDDRSLSQYINIVLKQHLKEIEEKNNSWTVQFMGLSFCRVRVFVWNLILSVNKKIPSFLNGIFIFFTMWKHGKAFLLYTKQCVLFSTNCFNNIGAFLDVYVSSLLQWLSV